MEDMHMDMGHDDSMGPASAAMQMSFYSSKRVTILLEGWQTTSAGNYLGSLLALLLMAFLYQYLELLSSSASPLLSYHNSGSRPSDSNDTGAIKSFVNVSASSTPLSTKLLLTLLFGARVGVAYLLMLAVMSFNAGVFIAVVLGFSAGFFVFRSDIHSPKST